MTVTATTPTTAQQTAATPKDNTALGRADLASNFNTFLSLLTTQLKNQDPLSPLDSNQFTQQLVQMTGVEQQLNTNDLLKQLVSNTATGVSTAVSMIGRASITNPGFTPVPSTATRAFFASASILRACRTCVCPG